MVVSFLSGAYKNAGDYLIEERAINLIKNAYPRATIRKFYRNAIVENIDSINSGDVVIFGGGPIFMQDLDGYLPVKFCTDNITRPMMVLGGGWFGFGCGEKQIYNYRFKEETYKLLKLIDKYGLSCRDISTYQILKAYGFENVYLTGCPAWYNLSYLDNLELRENKMPEKIVISDPAIRFNYKKCIDLVDFVCKKYRKSDIIFAFHRGLPDTSKALECHFINELEKREINIVDLSGKAEGFTVYDTCDLHIGYRVHAHIYNLSMRNKTVLIEEDGRGAGVNQTLGLPSIKAYNDEFQISGTTFNKFYKRSSLYSNKHVIESLDSYLELLDATGNQYLINAFKMQNRYFQTMSSFIKRIELFV